MNVKNRLFFVVLGFVSFSPLTASSQNLPNLYLNYNHAQKKMYVSGLIWQSMRDIIDYEKMAHISQHILYKNSDLYRQDCAFYREVKNLEGYIKKSNVNNKEDKNFKVSIKTIITRQYALQGLTAYKESPEYNEHQIFKNQVYHVEDRLTDLMMRAAMAQQGYEQSQKNNRKNKH